MKADAILLNANDNVVTTVNGACKGAKVSYYSGKELLSIDTTSEIPPCHKIALTLINKGDKVIKYGEIIGVATETIAKGGWVSHNNIISVPRNYDEEMK